jgi:putative transposase
VVSDVRSTLCNIQGCQQDLWRAVDQDGDVIDILVQPRRDRRAAERFFRKPLKGQGRVPRRLITDKLHSYSAAHSMVMPSVSRLRRNRAAAIPLAALHQRPASP